jgi:hypothetical protein
MDHESPRPAPRRNGANPPTRLLLSVLGLVCAMLTTATAASVYVAGDSARRAAAILPRVSLLYPETHHHGAAVHALIDSLIAPLGVLPPMDSAMLRDAVGVLGGGEHPDVWIPFDTARVAALDTAEFLRAWSRRAPLPSYWGYRPVFGGAGHWARLPVRRLRPVKQFALSTEAAADSALLAGDAESAMLRARELLAGSRHLLDQPLYIDMMIGRHMLQRGARLLSRAAQQGGQPMTAGAAKRLDALVEANYALSTEERRVLAAYAETPEDGRLVAFVADRGLPASLRAETPLSAMLTAACRNPREMMFGLSSVRRAAFGEMVSAMSDIPRMAEMTPLMLNALATFDSPAAFLATRQPAGEPDSARSLPFLLAPASLRARVTFCRGQGF